VEVSNQNIQGLSDNEEEKNDKFQKENEIKHTEEKIEYDNIPDKNSAFQIFKTESPQGREIESGILQNSEDLKTRKKEAKDFLEQCNTYKSQIENLKNALNEKKLNKLNLGDEMTELIDEEGYKLIDELKSIKQSYKDYLDKFKFAKSEINSLKSNLDMLKVKYVESFETWFFKKYGIKLEEHELKLSKVIYNR
jgi:chromosome segregation ATPase